MGGVLLLVGIGVAGRPFLDSARRFGFAVQIRTPSDQAYQVKYTSIGASIYPLF
jgi:hypothetical protein